MPTLIDEIMDEAQELAINKVMHPDAYDRDILDMIREIVRCDFSDDSIYAHAAIRVHRFWRDMADSVDGVFDTVSVTAHDAHIRRGYEDGA